ncbi:MAG: phosphotransferase [Candidatus Gracilibacteria bacterium]|nr:phosphotransferase [Candidatus Gracilibacteria bacterium]
MKHPTNTRLVIKIARPGEVDDIMKEFSNHISFYDTWEKLVSKGDIDPRIRVPLVEKGDKDGYFIMERVDGQSLHSKTLVERFDNRLSAEDKSKLLTLPDKQVREFLKTKLGVDDSYLDMIIEDYSIDQLAELMGTSYNFRKKYGKSGGTPLDNAVNILKENGLTHTDLHPGNVMLDKKGNTYIIDFGRVDNKINQ